MEKINFKIFLILILFVLLFNVGKYGVLETSDARYSEIAREMVVSGDYLHPNFLNVHHYHKPPLTYQITAIGYKIFGINPFGARFFLQIAIIVQILLVYMISLLLFDNKKISLGASLIYFSIPLVFFSSRFLTTDIFLTTFVLMSMYNWIKYRKEGAYKYLYLFYLSLALGFLTKGPVVFIVPLPFVLLYNKLEPSKNKFSVHHIISFVLFLCTASSWYIYLIWHNREFLDYFIITHTVDRFSTNRFHRYEPFWYFLVYAPLVSLPWSVNLISLGIQCKSYFKKKSIYTVLLATIVIPIIFFSLSESKLILYILPIFGVFAILTAKIIDIIDIEKFKKIYFFNFIYAILLVSLFVIVVPFTKYSISISIVIFGLFIISGLIYLYRNKRMDIKNKVVILNVILAIFIIIAGTDVMGNNQLKIKSSKPVTDFIIEKHLRDRTILVYNTRKPSIAFGLNKSIISLKDGSKKLNRETQFETNDEWKKYLLDLKDPSGIKSLKEIIKNPTVLILYKKPLPKAYKWLEDSYKNKVKMDKWYIYY